MLKRIATIIYQKTKFPILRKFYFETYAHLVKNKKCITNIDGVNFDLDLGELIELALFLGKFEPSVVRAINSYCRPGMIVLDIGANVGAHCLRLASNVGSEGCFYAFEPTQIAFTKLERNISLNPNLKIAKFRIALSNKFAKNCPISFRSSWKTDGSHQDSSCLVDFMRLDDWSKNNNVNRVDLIKIDVDGNEFDVLIGGIELLRRSRPVLIMEMVGPHFADPTRNPFLLLESLGYKFSNVDSGIHYINTFDMRNLMPIDDVEMTTSMNILAIASEVKG